MDKKKPSSEDTVNTPQPTDHPHEVDADSFSLCPVCGKDYRKDQICDHIVSWDYFEEGGNWPGKSDPWELYKTANELLDALATRFTAEQLAVVRMLLKLPGDLLPTLAAGIKEGETYSIWTDLIGELIAGSPGYVGSARADNEPSGPGTAGMWTNYWVENPKAAARFLDKKVNGFLKGMKQAMKATKNLPETESGEA